jgi:hypothetical protein
LIDPSIRRSVVANRPIVQFTNPITQLPNYSITQSWIESEARMTVDELMRRYEDLSKRAADLRSYL